MKKRILSLMLALALCLGLLPGRAWAEEEPENRGARKTRTTHLELTGTEAENEAEGWSWKKTDEEGYYYTLTLDNVNFEVSDNSAITFSVNKGGWLGAINIVLIGENRVVSTYQDDDNFYQTYGIRLATSSSYPPGEILVTGSGSLTAEGYRSGISLATGKLHFEGVTVNAQSTYPSGLSVTNDGSLLIENSTVNTNSISATSVTSINSDISVVLNSVPATWTYEDSLIEADSVDISGGTLTLSGSEERPAYSGITNNRQTSISLSGCQIDIRNVKYGLHVNSGTINLTNVQGTVFCTESGTLLYSQNPAFHANKLNVSGCSVYAQTRENILTYGNCFLPSEITELTVPGDLKIETGKTLTIGEGQRVTFTKNPARISDVDNTTLVNNGTLEFLHEPTFRSGTKLINNGTLIAPKGISYSEIPGVAQNAQVINNGSFDGLVKERSGTVWYVYGNVTQELDRTLGGAGAWINRTFVTTDAVLTIPSGKKLDASQEAQGLTWETLSNHLSVEEGGKIVVEEGGQLLLPPNPTSEQLNSLPITGEGTVKAGDVLVCTVHFDSQGGSEVQSCNLLFDQTVEKPADPTLSGYTFGGWYKEADCTTAWSFASDTVDGDITLYAKWTKNAPVHTHSYDTAWSSDDANHWKQCTCGKKAETEAHVFDNDSDATCDICGYTRHVHSWAWRHDDASHWKQCTCGEKIETGAHIYENDSDATCDTCGYTRTIVVPPTPPTPVGPGGSSSGGSSTATLPVTTTGQNSSTVITTTTAVPGATTKGGAAATTVSMSIGNEIVRQAVDNNSGTVIIAPKITGDVSKTTVSIPAATVEQIGSQTGASLTVSTPVADVIIPNEALGGLSKPGGAVSVTAEVKGSTVEFSVTAGGEPVRNIIGGVTVTVPVTASTPGTVAVLVYENGTRETIRKSVADGDSVAIPLNGSAKLEIVDNSKSFVDVPAESWAADAVAFASAHELFNGTSANTFGPDLSMTRGMLAVVLHNLENNPEQHLTGVFADVDDSQWYAEGVAWAEANGIVCGYGNGQFGPNDLITREQLAMMFWQYAGRPESPELALPFQDADQASPWAASALRWAVGQGILSGKGGGMLDPGGTATRAEAAQMLKNFLEKAS